MAYEEMEYRKFTGRAEADKAINSLKGLLAGINIDHKVNNSELLELDKWCEIHSGLINRNPFNEFLHTIRQAIREEVPAEEAVEDMYWLCQKYEDDNIFYDALTADLQTLQGICHGILADGEINEDEVLALEKWMNNNEHLASYYPYDELRTVLLKILKDGVVDEEETIFLKAYFKEFVKLTDKQLTEKITKETKDVRISGLCAYDPQINFDGTTFTATGVFSRGTRSKFEKVIDDLGGKIAKNVIKATDYLIVGHEGNPAWVFSCYGRKVEKARKMRQEGSNVILINELDFWDIVDDLKA